MKVLSSTVHGVLDYLGGVALLLAPTLFGFEELGGPAVLIPRALGILVLVQSVMTKYKLGLVKVIPFAMHLMMDYGVFAFLAISPWLFGFADEDANAWMPHLLVGLVYLVATAMTRDDTNDRA